MPPTHCRPQADEHFALCEKNEWLWLALSVRFSCLAHRPIPASVPGWSSPSRLDTQPGFISTHWCERVTFDLQVTCCAADFMSSSLSCPNSWLPLHTKIICHLDTCLSVCEGQKRWRDNTTSMSTLPPSWSLKNTSASLQMPCRYVQPDGWFQGCPAFYLGPSRKQQTAKRKKASEEEKLAFHFFLQRHKILKSVCFPNVLFSLKNNLLTESRMVAARA